MTSDDTLVRPTTASARPSHGLAAHLHLDTTVADALRLLPYGRVVLSAFRVDAGAGTRTLAEAARAADLEPYVLLDALRSTVSASFDAVRAGLDADGAR